ncbi:hypothetical protein [Vibrio coralliilyticus]|uniref:hypothetical protein n=1 Tax=Vibrio coralliilyticus TaxID=190893 RepID=UPI00155F988A|nr:hypothetical protein [Vibrio coralliilyticus]NRF65338.1 hypothetical protein [Vibrio coralliilyticus]
MSLNCQALVVQLNAWLWKVETTTTPTVINELLCSHETKQTTMQQPNEAEEETYNSDTAN